MILILWFKTEVWYEYTKIFRLGFLSKEKIYEEEKMDDVTMTYIKFLRKRYGRQFLIRMITCPICVCFWLAVFFGLYSGYLLVIPILFIGSLTIYGAIARLMDI
jgi:hypothetical protein